jgi:hypothetical protein
MVVGSEASLKHYGIVTGIVGSDSSISIDPVDPYYLVPRVTPPKE